jgi:hypothetical protein
MTAPTLINLGYLVEQFVNPSVPTSNVGHFIPSVPKFNQTCAVGVFSNAMPSVRLLENFSENTTFFALDSLSWLVGRQSDDFDFVTSRRFIAH